MAGLVRALVCFLACLPLLAGATSYQIEVIAFKRLNAQKTLNDDTDQSQRSSPKWPSNLIAIAPPITEPRTPFIWSQAVMLAEESKVQQRSDLGTSTETTAPKPVFLLASESKADLYRRRLEQLNLGKSSNANDPDIERDRLRRGQRDALLQTAFYPIEPFAYGALPASERQLNGPARSIRRSSLYELLLHQSWQQPIDATPTPILIQGGKQFGDRFELEGTLSLRRQRFLHVDADVWLTEFVPVRGVPSSSSPSALKAEFPELFQAAERGRGFAPGSRFHLTEKRRLRSGELHYLDHPALGVLLLITPLDDGQSL